MKWGRRKSPSHSLPLFPISWFSKLKLLSGANKSQPAKTKQKTKPKSPMNASIPGCLRPSRLSDSGFRSVSDLSFLPEAFDGRMGQREDDFWSFSFRKQRFECGEKSGNSEDGFEIQFSNCSSCRSSVEGGRKDFYTEFVEKFSNTPSEIRNKGYVESMKIEMSPKSRRVENAEELKKMRSESPRRQIKKDLRRRKADRRITEDEDRVPSRDKSVQGDEESQKQGPKISKMVRMDQTLLPNSRKSFQKAELLEEVHGPTALVSQTPLNLEVKPAKDQTMKDVRPRRKLKQKPKCRVHSPRIASRIEMRRAKALESLKKAKKKERETDETRSFENFAVVKRSFNPQKDFRESMVEMIIENRIERPEELESLLVCYLTLNSDEYHDLIVKVFQQVWFDLNRAHSISEFKHLNYN